MDVKFYNSLYGGDSPNGVKLCMGLTEGDFWARNKGAVILYQGLAETQMDFENIVAAVNASDETIAVKPNMAEGYNLFIIRKTNCCGDEEKTISASTNIVIDNQGQIVEPGPNRPVAVRAIQVEGNRILLKWFYEPVNQAEPIAGFNIYYDNATGVVDYETPLAAVEYAGRNFYSYLSSELAGERYRFCIKAVSIDEIESTFAGNIRIQINKNSPEPLDNIQVSAV